MHKKDANGRMLLTSYLKNKPSLINQQNDHLILKFHYFILTFTHLAFFLRFEIIIIYLIYNLKKNIKINL